MRETRGKSLDRRELLRSRAIDWNFFRSKWQQYGLRRGTCVEIGCDAGRLIAHLARYFRYVHGLDVCPGMIESPRSRVPANVSLHVTGGLEISLLDGSAMLSRTYLERPALRLSVIDILAGELGGDDLSSIGARRALMTAAGHGRTAAVVDIPQRGRRR